MTKTYHTYILTNHTNSVLYTGVTNNLMTRIAQHKQGQHINSFTKRYKIYKLVWFQEFASITQAIEAEKKIKGWNRIKKIELIQTTNLKWKDLTNPY